VWLVDGGESRRRASSFEDVVEADHRISVARYQGVEMIEAEVTEFRRLLSTGSSTTRIGHKHGRFETPTEKGAKTVAASRIMASYSQQ
jgi:hypothetical protein